MGTVQPTSLKCKIKTLNQIFLDQTFLDSLRMIYYFISEKLILITAVVLLLTASSGDGSNVGDKFHIPQDLTINDRQGL